MDKDHQLPHNISQRLRVLNVLDRLTQINLARDDMKESLRDMLGLMLEVFDADRAWLLYPCNPDAASWNIPVEVTRPKWPGLLEQGVDMPMDSIISDTFSELLKANRPIQQGSGTAPAVPRQIADMFSVKSQLMTAIRPKVGDCWTFGLHHCESEVMHGKDDLELFTAISQRIADFLNIWISIRLLRESESKFRTLYDSTSDAVILLDKCGFIDCNSATLTIFGCASSDQFCSKHPADFSPPVQPGGMDSSTLADQMIASAMEKGSHFFEWVHKRADTGENFPTEVLLNVMEINGKRIIQATVRDIAERKKYQNDLILAKEVAESANQAKSQFVVRIGHELRTPLNSILGFAQLMELAEDGETIADHREGVKAITQSGWHLLRLINDLIDLSAIEADKIVLHVENVELKQTVHACFELLRQLARQRRITLQYNEECKDIRVHADPFRLKQILINLLANAIKYNHEGGGITVSARPMPNERLCIAVSDTGAGIPEQDMPLLFQPFSRLHQRPLHIEGAGIGLSIAKKLTELMDGAIGVESAPGQGSTFWIELPKAQEPDPAPESRTESQGEGRAAGTGKLLLYIEDNPNHTELIRQLVTRMDGLSFVSANTPAHGLEMARSHHPDVILLDICLPLMDGYEVFRLLQEDSRTLAIPVIAVSASAIPADIEEALRLGFRRYITKPIKVTEFKKAVEELLHDNA